jgi:putative ATP-dependent endonuclease of OLD family
MHLTRIAVRNHSRLQDLELEVREHMVLIGPNDVGKSSLLRCLDLLLGASTAQLYSKVTIDDLRDPDGTFVVEVDLADFSADDQALFPDEITVGAGGIQSLTVRLEASFDANQTLSIQRFAPAGGTGRQLARGQLLGIGWTLLGATDGSRDIRDGRHSMLDDILSAVDLGAEQAAFDALIEKLSEDLHSSKVLEGIRGDLAGQLSRALPEAILKDDLEFIPGASADNDPLSGVRLQVRKSGVSRAVSDQSDGMRAIYAIALYDLISGGANMVGIDEPEVHLHPSSQRSLARLLQAGKNQKFLATHSSDVVSAFPAESIVVVRAGGVVVQPRKGFLSSDQRLVVRWWVRDRLEPLTARRVVGVEGISDRIVLERVAELTGRELDRLGVSVVETGGAGDMGAIWQLFGPDGFHVPMSLLIDRDAVADTARKLGVAEADLNTRSVWISDRDLEEEYTIAIGKDALWQAISASGLFSKNELANCQGTGPSGATTSDDVASFCRFKSTYKARAAMVVAGLLDEATARKIKSVDGLLGEITR